MIASVQKVQLMKAQLSFTGKTNGRLATADYSSVTQPIGSHPCNDKTTLRISSWFLQQCDQVVFKPRFQNVSVGVFCLQLKKQLKGNFAFYVSQPFPTVESFSYNFGRSLHGSP